MSRCEISDLPEEFCADCKYGLHGVVLGRLSVEELIAGPTEIITIAAKYPGICKECDKPINVGDSITNNAHTWAHTECLSY